MYFVLGSSKGMEPDMAATKMKNINEKGHTIQVINADSDSTTAARLRNQFKDLEKKNDKNHFKKNLSKQLYKLAQKHKELKPAGVIHASCIPFPPKIYHPQI
jgi:hypothetical protein